MTQTLYVGVDGGATKCVVRIEDEFGKLLGRAVTGPANINLSVTQTWQSIWAGFNQIVQSLGIETQDADYSWHAGMGLAGCEVPEDYQHFLQQPHLFTTLTVSTDAHIACLGAHNGKDGSVIVIGTGSVGFMVDAGHTGRVGGWGFPHDDLGSGAWLGFEAVSKTLQVLDGRLPGASLAEAIYAKFDNNLQALVTFANKATSTDFAALAPLVIKFYETGEALACQLMQTAAEHINHIDDALEKSRVSAQTILPCTLIGGLAPFIEPLLKVSLRARLVKSALAPEEGAILLVKNSLSLNSREVANV